MQHGQVGKFKVLDLLDSAVLEHGQVGRGCRFATSCSGQICFATKTCSWKPAQIGVAGQPLASELGWFDQCSWLVSTPRLCSVGLWQICNVAALPGDSFAWQQVGNLQCQCSMGRLASLKCWICLAGAADLQQIAVARSVLQSKPAVGTLCRLVMLQPCQVTALLGNKLETCSVSAAWAGWQVFSVEFA